MCVKGSCDISWSHYRGRELVRRVGGDLRTRLTMLIADWPAGKGEAVGDVLAELVGTIRAGMAATRLRTGSPGLTSRESPGPARCGGWIRQPIRRRLRRP